MASRQKLEVFLGPYFGYTGHPTERNNYYLSAIFQLLIQLNERQYLPAGVVEFPRI